MSLINLFLQILVGLNPPQKTKNKKKNPTQWYISGHVFIFQP